MSRFKALTERLMEPAGAAADRLALACFHVQAAIDGRAERPPPPPEAAASRRAHRAFAIDLRLQAWKEPVAYALVVVYFFQQPLWAVRAAERGFPGLYPNPLYPSFNVPTLPPWAVLAVEAVLLGVLAFDVGLNLVAQGVSRCWAHGRSRAAALVLGATVAATASSRFLPESWLPLGPYLRVALVVVHSHPVRNQLRVVQQAVPRFAGVATLLLLFLALSSWLAIILFPSDTAEGRAVMPSFGEASWQLLILLTTANFPDVMMPAYTANRLAALFFGTFLVLGLFFMMNLLLAVRASPPSTGRRPTTYSVGVDVAQLPPLSRPLPRTAAQLPASWRPNRQVIFDSFNTMRARNLQAAQLARRTHLGHAFTLLDEARRGSLDRGTLSALLDELDHAVHTLGTRLTWQP